MPGEEPAIETFDPFIPAASCPSMTLWHVCSVAGQTVVGVRLTRNEFLELWLLLNAVWENASNFGVSIFAVLHH